MENGARKIKALLFDKDGTLYDNAEIWQGIFRKSIKKALQDFGWDNRIGLDDDLLTLLGYDGEGKPISQGLVFNHRKRNILARSLRFCMSHRILVHRFIKLANTIYAYCDQFLEDRIKQIDFDPLKNLFHELKKKGYILGLITQDKESSTDVFLKYMGIADCLDFVTNRSDNLPKKPNPKSFNVFCEKFHLQSNEVAFIGDSKVDMEYAQNALAGYKIGILWGSGDKEALEKGADIIYPDIYGLYSDTVLFEE